jgi:glutathione synthase
MRLAVVIGSPLRYSAWGRTGACLLHEAHRRGHKLWCLTPDAIYEEGRRLLGDVYDVTFPVTEDVGTFWRRLQVQVAVSRPVAVELEGADALLWRKDPPLHRRAARCLSSLSDRIPSMNDPRALLLWASKARALERFGHLMPPSTLVTDETELRGAVDDIPGALIVKPLEEAGGRGVIRLRVAERPYLARRVAAEPLLASNLAAGAGLIVQQEVRGPVPGDLRLLCLDGRVMGAFRRVPGRGEFRANVSAGARVAPARPSQETLGRCEAVASELAREGLPLVGLDVVGRWLLEVNVISPGGIPRLNALLGRRLERDVLAWIEGRAGFRVAVKAQDAGRH